MSSPPHAYFNLLFDFELSRNILIEFTYSSCSRYTQCDEDELLIIASSLLNVFANCVMKLNILAVAPRSHSAREEGAKTFED